MKMNRDLEYLKQNPLEAIQRLDDGNTILPFQNSPEFKALTEFVNYAVDKLSSKIDCRDKKCTECDGECFLEDDEQVTNARPARYEGYDCWKSEEDECSKDCPTCEHGVKQQEDMVEYPSHYQNGKYEVIDEMLIVFGPQKTYDFCILNSWKYRARAPFKGKTEEDMEKSSRYLEYAKWIADTYNEVGATKMVMEAKRNGTGQ